MSPEFESITQLLAAVVSASATLFHLAAVHYATVSELYAWLAGVAGTSPEHLLAPLVEFLETASSTLPTQ